MIQNSTNWGSRHQPLTEPARIRPAVRFSSAAARAPFRGYASAGIFSEHGSLLCHPPLFSFENRSIGTDLALDHDEVSDAVERQVVVVDDG